MTQRVAGPPETPALNAAASTSCSTAISTWAIRDRGEGRLFGGMVAAQSAVAAYRTVVRDRPLHSLHAYFLRPGRHDVPIRFVVDRIRDGKYVHDAQRRRAPGRRGDFEPRGELRGHPEVGISYQERDARGAAARHAEHLEAQRARALGWRDAIHGSAVELRLCDGYDLENPTKTYEPRQRNGVRADGSPTIPSYTWQCWLHLTDRALLMTAARAHGLPWDKRISASLDHSVWIHRPIARGSFMLDESWMLYASQSPVGHAARSLIFGGLDTSDGVRFASVAQEAVAGEGGETRLSRSAFHPESPCVARHGQFHLARTASAPSAS